MAVDKFTAVGLPNSLVRYIGEKAEQQLQGRLPDFSPGPCLVTDFGGEHKGATFHTYGFLLCPAGGLASWDEVRKRVREPELGSSVMGYKHLGDGRRERALLPFLDAADCIPGFLAVVAVSKNVGLVGSEELKAHPSMGKWKLGSREKLARILPMAVGFVGGLLSHDANVTWITDRDEITEGGRLQGTVDALKAGLLGVRPRWTGQLHAASTGSDGADLLYEDITAIPDLAAGAISDVLNADSISIPADVRPKTKTIIQWMGRSDVQLARVGYTLERMDDGRLELAQLGWGLLEEAVNS